MNQIKSVENKIEKKNRKAKIKIKTKAIQNKNYKNKEGQKNIKIKIYLILRVLEEKQLKILMEPNELILISFGYFL